MEQNPEKINTTIDDARLIDIPKVHDVRGNLSVVEGNTIPFKMNRIYYLYDVPGGEERGGHAHIDNQAVVIALSGSFDVVLKDGTNAKTIMLNKPSQGLLIPTGIWRELQNFSSGSVCLVIASDLFTEDDYIREYDDFVSFKNRRG
ncbi:FdtA/QdtA family cupin domain-containing protein [Flavobacterium sp.]|uniref:sugar 3,4-ketoisomerase n=1 Tax=Flavobacterium sp. TaxID=239 RepID=UPI002638D740|nr:FdtA/QdtA family cupin domain-containing protein [Flavobacterium sp.]